ncbi:hypothetical protein ACFL09_06475, partial [Planctomycetota bacterium]
LERVGNTSIEAANSYSENTTVRVTAVIKDGVTCTTFTGTVNFAEIPPSDIYTQNGGTLPASVTISSAGTTTFVAKSIAGAQEPYTTPPDDAVIEPTNYSFYNPGGTGLEIPQWVDNDSDDRVDWCQFWTNSLLVHYQIKTGEPAGVTNQVTGIGADTYEDNSYGSTVWEGTVFRINPAAPDHRTNADKALADTVLHESRHVFQSFDGNRGVGDDDGNGPDNDDDAGSGDLLPELVYYASERDPNGIQDGDDAGTGDNSSDDYDTIALPAIQADAIEFAANYRNE